MFSDRTGLLFSLNIHLHIMAIYRVGLIGCGMIGKVHAYGYATLPFYCDPPPLSARITHVVTAHQESAQRACDQLGASVAAVDYRAITESDDIDIVHICSPNADHAPALLSAMAHGKHIYCDKPLTATLAEAEQIEAVLGQYRGIAQMTLQNRFFSATLRAKQLVEAGFLGDLLSFRALYLHGGSANPAAPARWKLMAAGGGGVIADLGPHLFDLVEHLAGPIRSVLADTHIAYPQRPAPGDPNKMLAIDAEESVTALVKLRSGVTGTLEASKIALGAEDELRIELHGSRGALRFNTMEPHYLDVFDGADADRPYGGMRGWRRVAAGQRYEKPDSDFPTPKASIGWIRSHVACLSHFLQAVAEGKAADPGLAVGVRLQRLLDATARSAKERRWIDLIDNG
jgi:predicted dehydrogenase